MAARESKNRLRLVKLTEQKEKIMIYDELEVGDVLEWKLMGNQSKMVIITKIEEELVYGSGKGKPKTWKLVGYTRGLYSFDEEPEKSNLSDIKKNCKRPKTHSPVVLDDQGEPLEDSETRETQSAENFDNYSDSEIVYEDFGDSAAPEFYDNPDYNDEDGDGREAARREFLETKTTFAQTSEPKKPQKDAKQLLLEERLARSERMRNR